MSGTAEAWIRKQKKSNSHHRELLHLDTTCLVLSLDMMVLSSAGTEEYECWIYELLTFSLADSFHNIPAINN